MAQTTTDAQATFYIQNAARIAAYAVSSMSSVRILSLSEDSEKAMAWELVQVRNGTAPTAKFTNYVKNMLDISPIIFLGALVADASLNQQFATTVFSFVKTNFKHFMLDIFREAVMLLGTEFALTQIEFLFSHSTEFGASTQQLSTLIESTLVTSIVTHAISAIQIKQLFAFIAKYGDVNKATTNIIEHALATNDYTFIEYLSENNLMALETFNYDQYLVTEPSPASLMYFVTTDTTDSYDTPLIITALSKNVSTFKITTDFLLKVVSLPTSCSVPTFDALLAAANTGGALFTPKSNDRMAFAGKLVQQYALARKTAAPIAETNMLLASMSRHFADVDLWTAAKNQLDSTSNDDLLVSLALQRDQHTQFLAELCSLNVSNFNYNKAVLQGFFPGTLMETSMTLVEQTLREQIFRSNKFIQQEMLQNAPQIIVNATTSGQSNYIDELIGIIGVITPQLLQSAQQIHGADEQTIQELVSTANTLTKYRTDMILQEFQTYSKQFQGNPISTSQKSVLSYLSTVNPDLYADGIGTDMVGAITKDSRIQRTIKHISNPESHHSIFSDIKHALFHSAASRRLKSFA